MALLRFLDFILEKSENKEFPFFYSNAFKEKLERIDSPISNGLLEMKYAPFIYSMISVGKSSDTVTVVSSSKLIELYPEFQTDKMQHFRPRMADVMWSEGNIEMKIGRFVKKVFGKDFTDSEIETFVNKWKSLDDSDNFEIWTKYQIKNGYNSTNYHYTDYPGTNPLIGSCMNDYLHLIEFYEYCPSVKLLVLLDDDNLILGRALVWKDHKDRIIMDRVYYVYDKDYYKFTSYAVKNGWYYKKRNISGGSSFMKGDEQVSLSTKVKITNVFDWIKDGSGLPYMDTFYYAQGEWAMNQPPDGRYFKLNDTEGGYSEESGLYDVHGTHIEHLNDYVHSKEQGGLVYIDSAIHLQYDGGMGFSSYKFDDWIEEPYLMNPKNGFVKSKADDKWYKEKDCVWSEKEDSWLYRPDAIYNKTDWVHWDNFNPGGNNI